MFKQRLKMVGWFFLYLIILGAFAGLITLLFDYFEVYDKINSLLEMKYTPFVALGVFVIMVIYYIVRFVNWLVVEPFKNRKVKK